MEKQKKKQKKIAKIEEQRQEELNAKVLYPTTDPDALLREGDAADLLNLSARTLQTWRCEGDGPAFVRAGRAIRYRRRDVLAWVAAKTVNCSRPKNED